MTAETGGMNNRAPCSSRPPHSHLHQSVCAAPLQAEHILFYSNIVLHVCLVVCAYILFVSQRKLKDKYNVHKFVFFLVSSLEIKSVVMHVM